MDETKKRYVPAWVRDDPKVLAEWLSIDWEAEAKLYEELGGRQNQVVFGGVRRPVYFPGTIGTNCTANSRRTLNPSAVR